MRDSKASVDDGLMTSTEVCHFFKIGKSTLYEWANRGLLESTKVGGSRRWLRSSVLKLAASKVGVGQTPDEPSKAEGGVK